jgi:dolichol-phosphate mannosyltransferase
MENDKKNLLFRLIKFGIVGTSGIFVNQGILLLCVEKFDIDYRIASLMAIETAIVSNFILNYHWTWKDRKAKKIKEKATAFLKFNTTSFVTAFLLNWITLVFLTEFVGLQYKISNLVGIFFAAGVNFFVSNFWVFRKKQSVKP